MYWKKMIYLDYIEYGSKVKNVGHVKVLLHQDTITLDLHLRGLFRSDSLLANLLGVTGEGEAVLGSLCIDQGACYYNGVFPAANMDGKGLDAEKLCGVRIVLSDSRYVEALWKERKEASQPIPFDASEDRQNRRTAEEPERELPQEETPQGETPQGETPQGETPKKETPNYDAGAAELKSGQKAPQEGFRISFENTEKADRPKTAADETAEREAARKDGPDRENLWAGSESEKSGAQQRSKARAGRCRGNGEWRENSGRTVSEQNKLYENKIYQDKIYQDKWEQLCHTYQVVHPFGEEDYISLSPKDFVILRQEYQQLVNNSFLLHGFYNYNHLILGKMRGEEGIQYYLGVPGNYYEREKLVAVMFGFEGFESESEDIEPGTFGYYMRKVEI